MDNLPSDLDFSSPIQCVLHQVFDMPADPRTIQQKALPALARRVRNRVEANQAASSSSSHNPRPPEAISVPELESSRPSQGIAGRKREEA